MASCQTTDRHAQERCQEHDVGKERQVEHMRREPTNGGQFQKQNDEAYKEQLEALIKTRSVSGLVFSRGSSVHSRAATGVNVASLLGINEKFLSSPEFVVIEPSCLRARILA